MAIKVKLFLHIYIFFTTFAARTNVGMSAHQLAEGSRHNKKRLLALVLVSRNLVNFIIAQNKKAINALWDMTIPPQSVHVWTALFGGISYSAWALLAYSCERVYQNLVIENKQR